LSQADQHRKYHHHHESEDKNENEDDKSKHEHHHTHKAHGEHDVLKRGHKKDKMKHSCKKDQDEEMTATKESVQKLMDMFIEMFKSGFKMTSINGTTNLVIVVATRGGSVHVSGQTGNVTYEDGNSLIKVEKLNEESIVETTRDVRSTTSDSRDVSNSMSSEEMTTTTTNPVTNHQLETTLITEPIVNPLVSVGGVTTVGVEVENVTEVFVGENEDETTTSMTILNSLN
jgi:hypothetical protein